ncbi:MAG: CoA transferase [Devosia sp.]
MPSSPASGCPNRVKHRDLVDEAIGGWFAGRDRDTALKVMREAGATVGPIYSIADIAADPRFAEREIVIDVEDDQFGSLPMHNIPLRLAATPAVWRRPAPGLGEHGSEVLAEAGIDPAKLAEGAAA